jgi:hypothetical protein
MALRLQTLVICLMSYGSIAQDTLSAGSFLRLDVDNDAIQMRARSVSDRYYTSGLKVSYLSNCWRRWPPSRVLLRLQPQSDRTYTTLYGLTVGQEIYTPRDIKSEIRPLYPNDRPYAGYLYLSWGAVTTDLTGARRLTSSLSIGAIGPVAGAAEVQQTVHRLLKQPYPAGWNTQMRNDPMVSYYVKYEGRAIPHLSPAVDIIGHVEGHVGSLMNYMGMGGMVRIGLFNDYFLHPAGLYPSVGNTPARRKFQFYAVVGASFRAILDNALLQGGWFSQKNYYSLPAVEMEHFYGQAHISGVIAYKNAQLTFTQQLRTTEFVDALESQWGQLSLLVKMGQ